MICIENLFADIVEGVNTDLNGHGLSVNFRFGTLREIVEHLNSLTQAGNPLIALVEPFRQERGIMPVESRMKLRFLIATYTPQDLKAEERLELNFKPVLFPVYEAFLNRIKHSGHFRTDEIKHTVINHFEIGREVLAGYDGSVFNDHIDAVEILDMELDAKNKQCKIKNF